MSDLSKDAAAARAMGLSYGEYKALSYNPQKDTGTAPKRPQGKEKIKRLKHYSDHEVFRMWQEGKTDSEIAAAFGISRTVIQRWRDQMELPSTTKHKINTKKYRLIEGRDGGYYVVKCDRKK